MTTLRAQQAGLKRVLFQGICPTTHSQINVTVTVITVKSYLITHRCVIRYDLTVITLK